MEVNAFTIEQMEERQDAALIQINVRK